MTAEQLALKLGGLKLEREDIEMALHAGALVVEGAAKQAAPVLTGALRRNIGVEVKVNGSVGVAKIGNSSAIPYARAQEFGGRKKGYLRQSLRNNAEEVVADVAEAIRHRMKDKLG